MRPITLALCLLLTACSAPTIVAPTLPAPVTVIASEGDEATAAPSPTAMPSAVPAATATAQPTLTPAPLTTASVLTITPPAYIAAEGLEVLGLINAWRVGIDLWPLAPNADLSALAQAQADYLGSLEAWPENIHEDASGGVSDDRARAAGWPAYDDAGQAVAVTEIIAAGATPQEAVDWWRGSEIHSWVISQAYYREVGVGVIEREFSTTYVVVVGSRPNVLPAMYDPLRGDLYLTNELYSGGYDGILWDAQRVQFLPSVDAPPADSGWIPHAVRYDVAPPPGAVVYEGAISRVTVAVDGIAWLPHVVATVGP